MKESIELLKGKYFEMESENVFVRDEWRIFVKEEYCTLYHKGGSTGVIIKHKDLHKLI